MVLLASRQIGMKPKARESRTAPTAAAKFIRSKIRSVVAAAIPWVHPDPTPLRTSNLRAPGDLARIFASESFMDEIASGVGVDPVQFRLRYLASNKRPTDVLLAATQKAGWQERPSPAPASRAARTQPGEAWPWRIAPTP